jgi:hypothetical protein
MKKKSKSAEVAKPTNDWQAEGDCDTLIRAREIKNDPKRYKAAMDVANQRLAAIKDVAA